MWGCPRTSVRSTITPSPNKRALHSGKAKSVEEGAQSMTYIPTESGFMRLEDSGRLLHAIFPNYPSLQPCHPAPCLEPIGQGGGDRRICHVSHHCCNLPGVHARGSSHHGSYQRGKHSLEPRRPRPGSADQVCSPLASDNRSQITASVK